MNDPQNSAPQPNPVSGSALPMTKQPIPGGHSVTDESEATYHVVTDLVVGLNVRKSDNLFQLKCIGLAMAILSPGGGLLAAFRPEWGLPWQAGILGGAFAGLVLGVFGSGVFLMIYRAIRHLRGQHD